MESYCGQISAFGLTYAVWNWALCWGARVSINQYTELYAVIGDFYGGDGWVTLGLPDLRGRGMVSSKRSGFSGWIGQIGGGVTSGPLDTKNLPQHAHTATLTATSDPALTQINVSEATTKRPDSDSNYFGKAVSNLYKSGPTDVSMAPADVYSAMEPRLDDCSVTSTGNGQAFDTLSPYLAVNYQICLIGSWPSRS